MSRKSVLVLAATLLVMGLGSASYGALLIDFKPDPVSPSLDEIGWVGNQLVQGTGSVGNGDGNLTAINQTPGGLNIQTPLYLVGLPGSTTNAGDNSTTFYDVTLQLTGLAASAAPSQQTIFPGMVVVAQPVSAGTFTLLSTDPDGAGPLSPVVLLTGTINDAAIVGLLGQTTASIQSSTVTYTGGPIYSALIASGGSATGANLSWSLLDVNNGLSVVSGGSFGMTLQPFGANMTGQFTPEPATLCLMALGAVAVLVRRRKR